MKININTPDEFIINLLLFYIFIISRKNYITIVKTKYIIADKKKPQLSGWI